MLSQTVVSAADEVISRICDVHWDFNGDCSKERKPLNIQHFVLKVLGYNMLKNKSNFNAILCPYE